MVFDKETYFQEICSYTDVRFTHILMWANLLKISPLFKYHQKNKNKNKDKLQELPAI